MGTWVQCRLADIGRNSRHFGGFIFGYDFLNGSESGWSDIIIRNPDIDFSTQADGSGAPTVGVGINFENHQVFNSNPDVDGRIAIEHPTISWGINGLAIHGGWKDVRIYGGLYQAAYKSGILMGNAAPNLPASTLDGVTVLAPVCRWNNQKGSAQRNASGMQIGADPDSGDSVTVQNVVVLGGSYYDDSGNPNGQTLAQWRAGGTGGTATQVWPISVWAGTTNSVTKNIAIKVNPGQMYGNLGASPSTPANMVFQQSPVSGTAASWVDETAYSLGAAGKTTAFSPFVSYNIGAGGLFLIDGWVTLQTGGTGTFQIQLNATAEGSSSPANTTISSVTGPGTATGTGLLIYLAAGSTIVINTLIGTSGTYSFHVTLRQLSA
jgi:hypothetical protein